MTGLSVCLQIAGEEAMALPLQRAAPCFVPGCKNVNQPTFTLSRKNRIFKGAGTPSFVALVSR